MRNTDHKRITREYGLNKKTISLPETLLARGMERAGAMHYATFSDYVQELIRRDTAQLNVNEGAVEYKIATEKQRAAGKTSEKPIKKVA